MSEEQKTYSAPAESYRQNFYVSRAQLRHERGMAKQMVRTTPRRARHAPGGTCGAPSPRLDPRSALR